jgi:K+-sensing histidine kinase KdpD
VGLAVVRGFADAMGAHVAARRSELGGLAMDLDLPLAEGRPEDEFGAEPGVRPGAA